MKPQTGYNYLNIIPFSTLINWSASFALGNKFSYKKDFDLVKIGDIITRNKTKVIIQDNVTYKRVTIKLYGKGVVLRDEVSGREIGTKNQYQISGGQFIMSKIDARNGAFGLVPPDLDGAVVTQDFLNYDINSSLVLPDFFLLLTTTKNFLSLCQRASSGTTGRKRVDENIFLNFQIPIPNVDFQKELLDKVNSQRTRIDLKRVQIQQNKHAIDTYLSDKANLPLPNLNKLTKQFVLIRYKNINSWSTEEILHQTLSGDAKSLMTSLKNNASVVQLITRGKSPKYNEKGTHIILNQKCNRWNEIEIKHAKRVDDVWYNTLDPKLFTQENDIIVNSTGEGTIGRASLITKEHAGYIYDSHMLLLRVNTHDLNPLYLVYIINSEFGQQQINKLKSAKSTKQTELGVQNLLRFEFPLIEKSAQDEIVDFISMRERENKELSSSIDIEELESLSDFEDAIFTTENLA